MKVKPEIKERIVAAADALAAEGIESPTNDQVRERMGSGSLSNISPVMREWRESRKAATVAALEMPAELKKAIESSVGQMWTAASKLASATIDTVRQEADTAIETATGERDEALAEITRLETRIAGLEKALADQGQEADRVKTELEQERGQNTKLNAENAALVARVDDRGEQIRGLRAELKDVRNDNKALQGELIEFARKAKK